MMRILKMDIFLQKNGKQKNCWSPFLMEACRMMKMAN